VHLFGFVIKKFVTMHCHMNVKYRFSLEAHELPSGLETITISPQTDTLVIKRSTEFNVYYDILVY